AEAHRARRPQARRRQGVGPGEVGRPGALTPRSRMSELAPPTPESVVRDYIRAKDENRPHVLDRVFAPDAVVEIRNPSAAIAFPAPTSGRAAIADVLVRSFGQTHENVYPFCLQRPAGRAGSFDCDWIVAMTERSGSRSVRVGRGRYAWRFDPDARLASRL